MLQRERKQLNSPISILTKVQKINNSLHTKFSTKKQLADINKPSKIITTSNLGNKKPAALEAHTGLNEIKIFSKTMITKNEPLPQALIELVADYPDVSLEVFRTHLEAVIERNRPYLDASKVYMPTDAEWDAVIKAEFGNWIQSSSIVIYPVGDDWAYKVFIFTTNNLSKKAKNTIRQYFDRDWVVLIDCDVPEQLPQIEQFLVENSVKAKVIQLMVKYSPLDLHSYFGTNLWVDEILKNKVIEQKRCLRFNNRGSQRSKRRYKPSTANFDYEIRDIHGLNMDSIGKQALSVAVEPLAKSLMDEYKTKMSEGYEIKPVTATIYNLCDTLLNFEIAMSYIPIVNEIITNVLGLPESCKITEKQLRHTTGSLDGYFLTNYIEYYPYVLDKNVSQDDLDLWRIALRRFCILKSDLTAEGYYLGGLINEGLIKCTTLNDIKNYKIKYRFGKKENIETLYDLILHPDKAVYDRLVEYKIYEQACIRFFGSDVTNSKVFGAIVQGGRCNNSFPHKSYLKWVLDGDMFSAYGSTLRSLEYPIGLPKSEQHDLNEGAKPPLFKKAFDRLSKQLVNNLWVADVSTNEKLNFDCDLIYSSLNVTPEKINKSVGGSHYDEEGFEVEDDVKKIPSDFALIRTELEHGKITACTMEKITAIGTIQEKSDLWKKLQCNNIIYYSKKERVDNPIEWAAKVLKDKGKISQDSDNDKSDTRTRLWFPLPLENFIGKLVDRRKSVKKQMKNLKENSKEYLALNAFQEMLKLLVNTTYGDLASVYFSFGNVVLANVITDKARVGAWMMSKALRTRQEITDGGFYSPKEVAFIRGKYKPGFDILSDSKAWVDTKPDRLRSLEPMAGLDWEKVILERKRLLDLLETNLSSKEKYHIKQSLSKWENMVDRLALEHINSFWSAYGLKFEFNIEHKYKNTAFSAGYINKSDYCFLLLNGKLEIKKRGGKELTDYQRGLGLVDDPAFDLLRKLAKNDTSEYNNCPYNVSHIVKIGEWIEAKEDSEIKKLYPGQDIISSREPRQMNNRHIYIKSKDMYEKLKKRRGIIRGERAIWFERYINQLDTFLLKVNENELD